MSPLSLIILFTAAAIVLIIGELLLPTHGVFGVTACLSAGVAVILLFTLNRWAGLGTLAGMLLVAPLLTSGLVKLWTRTPVGQRVVLHPDPIAPAPPAVALGQEGVAVSELRPSGEVEFGGDRLQVISELGLISPGTRVRVVALTADRPMVRAV